MQTHVIRTNWIEGKQVINPEDLKVVADLLIAGETVAFPTETVYGLGANALSEEAVAKIFTAKGRPSDNPLIVHISHLEMLDDLIRERQEYTEALMDAFWPGPITFVFKKSDKVPLITTGGLDTVAVRMPSHDIACAIIKASDCPIAAPSANLSGKPSPTKPEHVVEDLRGRVAAIVAGEEANVGLESTVLDVTGPVPMILRPGAITKEMVASVVGGCEIDQALVSSDEKPRSPGMKYKHYAPVAEVTTYIGDNAIFIEQLMGLVAQAIESGEKIGVMVFEEDLAVLNIMLMGLYPKAVLDAHVFLLNEGSVKHQEVLARQLFTHLRACDEAGCSKIAIHGVSEAGIGHAIMNRLKKASEGRIVTLR